MHSPRGGPPRIALATEFLDLADILAPARVLHRGKPSLELSTRRNFLEVTNISYRPTDFRYTFIATHRSEWRLV